MIRGIEHTAIAARDVAALADWYVAVLGFTIVYTAVVTWILLKLVGLVIKLRVDEEQESEGLDLALHNERGYNL